MRYDRRGGGHGHGGAGEVARAPKIGASTLVQTLGGRSTKVGASTQTGSRDAIHETAAAGVAGGGGPRVVLAQYMAQ